MEIQYLVGDATEPQADGNKIIVHVCNDIGGWGRGFVLALSKRWAAPEDEYRLWCNDGVALGDIQLVRVEEDLWVCNLIGQRDVRPINGVPPVRYEAIRIGLGKLAEKSAALSASVHMPRIGCGLAGGEWTEVERAIQETLIAAGISTYVYDLP